ncbi:hypothetical protein OIU76_012198 [Salix suchowensis]|nr:hypothetical protein OIU76_012198 [Salix suchowensis]
METKNSTTHNDLFSSLISDIKSYSGNDPLLPWLRGIKKMKECLPPNALKQKLPRFLQKCTQSFESDRRYRNDSRYLRVWLQLMDYVSDPRVLLSTMEKNSIGTKRSLFYQAYALYHEKMKNFEEAENMYRLGVQNLAEPVDELQKSYEQFLHQILQRQIRRSGKRPRSSKSEDNNENVNSMDDRPKQILDGRKKEHVRKIEPKMCHGDDTVVVKFVDTAIVGKQEAEDACHHGLVDPTINMKEAMNAINGMFREPLETFPVSRSRRSRPKEECNLNNGFDVFIDENLDSGTDSSLQKEEAGISLMVHGRSQIPQTHQEPFQIFIDDEESDDNGDRAYDDKSEESKAQNLAEGSWSSVLPLNAFVFPSPKDLPSESSDYMNSDSSPRLKLREDTVVHRFVGSTILEEPAVENVCHHGLVDPTINLKEAMDDINNMFGKPIDFIRTKRPKKQEKSPRLGNRIFVDLQYFLMMIQSIYKDSHQPGHPERATVICLSQQRLQKRQWMT